MLGRRTFYLETLGCPKNQVDSDKLVGTFLADGLTSVDSPEQADLVVVNTCAFIEEARQESIDTVLALADRKSERAELVVTGCMAERYGPELAEALPEVDAVAGFGVPVTLGRKPGRPPLPSFDLLNLPRPPAAAPWAYVKVAEGCDKKCGFCAIPSFRGPQRSRSIDQIVDEVEQLAATGVQEIVLVAQDLASYGRDQGVGAKAIVPLVEAVAARVAWVRLLYLYPSELTSRLVDAILATGVAYFDLSLQHVSAPLVRRMRRWGDGDRFLARIAEIRTTRAARGPPVELHRGLPGRDRGRSGSAARVHRPRPQQLQPYPFEKLAHAAGRPGAGADADSPVDRRAAARRRRRSSRRRSLDTWTACRCIRRRRASIGLREAMAAWFVRRYGLPALDAADPGAAGQRHARGAVRVRPGRDRLRRARRRLVVCPNPFYQIYEGAALLAGAEPVFLNQTADNGFGLDLDVADSGASGRGRSCVYVCSPGNPIGPRADARRLARALRALGSLRVRHRVRRVLFGDLRRRSRAAARRARGGAAAGPRRASRTWWCSTACRSGRTRRGCAPAPSPETRRCCSASCCIARIMDAR